LPIVWLFRYQLIYDQFN